jgi:hypothetical protein
MHWVALLWLCLTVICSGCSPLIYLAAGGGPDEALPLTLGTPVRGSTAGAQNDYESRCSGQRGANDMEYTLMVREEGRYAFGVRADYDVVIAIYDDERLIACNDDHDARSTARFMTDLEAGRRYRVVVDGFGGAEGQYVLVAEARPRADEPVSPEAPTGEGPQAEDSAALQARCETAPRLESGRADGVLIPTDAHAVVSCAAGGRGPEAIYRVVLESRSEVVVAVTSDLDAVVELRRGCSEGHEALACVDDDPDARHTGLSAVLDPGEYFLLVDSYSPDAGGPFHLEVSITPQDEEREP